MTRDCRGDLHPRLTGAQTAATERVRNEVAIPKKADPHTVPLPFPGSGAVFAVWSRSGETGAWIDTVGFFRQTLAALKDFFNITRVLFDSGFYVIKIAGYRELQLIQDKKVASE